MPARSAGERADRARSNKRSGLRRTSTDPRTVQTDAAVSIEPIPIDSERLAFDGDAGIQDDESHLSDGVHGFSGGVGHLTIQLGLGLLLACQAFFRLALVLDRG